MVKAIQIFITLCCTSFFFFPFYPSVLPFVNTKMIMAACGLMVLGIELATNTSGKMNMDFIFLTFVAFGVSGATYLSMVINDTPDDSYLTYFMSMWVWIGAAYFVTKLIKRVHNQLSIELVCYYLITVSVCQCLIAITADMNASFKGVLDSMMATDDFMGTAGNRMHGLGCALDVAGSRFAVMLVMIAFLLPRFILHNMRSIYFWALLIAYFIIAFIGNMIGRTCLVGVVVSICYFIYAATISKALSLKVKAIFSSRVLLSIASALLVIVYLYNTSPIWKKNIDFGFEGPISLIEKGKWEVESNEKLHYAWPDNLHTWIIGDGYMAGTEIDPYYAGMNTLYWYAGTDAGYSRFLFYFGIVGLAMFTFFIFFACHLCARKFPKYRLLFLMFFTLNMIVWLKVSTDLFLVFAPFLCISKKEQEDYLLAIKKEEEMEEEGTELEKETEGMKPKDNNSLCHI